MWYTSPGKTWVSDYLPIGNGYLAGEIHFINCFKPEPPTRRLTCLFIAMIPGGTSQEFSQLNIESLWSGGPFAQPVREPCMSLLMSLSHISIQGYDGQSKPLSSRGELAKFVQQSRQAVFASPNGTISSKRPTR